MGKIDAILVRVMQADKTIGIITNFSGLSKKTIELPWKDNAPRVSCIPNGVYQFVKEYSPHAKKKRIELKGVAGRSEIQIHAGTKTEDVKGCIGIGAKYDEIEFYDSMPETGFIKIETIKI